MFQPGKRMRWCKRPPVPPSLNSLRKKAFFSEWVLCCPSLQRPCWGRSTSAGSGAPASAFSARGPAGRGLFDCDLRRSLRSSTLRALEGAVTGGNDWMMYGELLRRLS